MKKLMWFKSIIVLGIAICFCAGCAKQTNFCNYDLQYGMTCSPVELNALTNTIRHQGIQVSYLGDSIYVVIPTKQLFYPKTNNLNMSAPPTLNLVARFLACYQKITVRVVGFSNVWCSKRSNAIFAKKQAQAMVDELWRRGSDARFMRASGSSTTKGDWGNRMEIITKRLP
jgi:outer membrane protein OmpA-like peptidoglycan-associated protein